MEKSEVISELRKYAIEVKHVVDPKHLTVSDVVVLKLPDHIVWSETGGRSAVILRGRKESEGAFWSSVQAFGKNGIRRAKYVDNPRLDEPVVDEHSKILLGLSFVGAVVLSVAMALLGGGS